MANATFNSPAVGAPSFFVGNLSGATNLRYETLLTQSGDVLTGTYSQTYQTLRFDSGGRTYEYGGQFTIGVQSGLLVATVASSGFYTQAVVREGGAVLATYEGVRFDVDFGARTSVPLLDLVGVLLTDVIGLLIGGNNGGTIGGAYANLNTDATPTLPALAFAGDDTVVGSAGNDFLSGGAGADRMIGGAGSDLYFVDSIGDTVIEAAGGGFDTVSTSVSYALGAGQEIEGLVTASDAGTGALALSGNEFANVIRGNAGNNFISGGAGADTLIGLGGSDLYFVDNLGDAVIEAANGGFDTVSTSVSYVLGAGQEIEGLVTAVESGTDALALTGNEFANVIRGNAGNNIISGGAGADTLIGLGGSDLYFVDNLGDVVIEAAGGGFDTVSTSVSYVLGAGQEIEGLVTSSDAGTDALALTGNEFANVIRGNAGNNIISGGAGADTLIGLGGSDLYFVDNAGDVVIEAAGGGSDTVVASVSYALGAGQEIEALVTASDAGTEAINLTGNAFGNVIRGNAGANVLDGGLGLDTLIGGAGADTFRFSTTLSPANLDVILDFQVGVDKLQLDHNVFVSAGLGSTVDASELHFGTGAADGNDYLIYDQSTGALSFDSDGTGGAGAVQFALLSPGLALTASDFQII